MSIKREILIRFYGRLGSQEQHITIHRTNLTVTMPAELIQDLIQWLMQLRRLIKGDWNFMLGLMSFLFALPFFKGEPEGIFNGCIMFIKKDCMEAAVQ